MNYFRSPAPKLLAILDALRHFLNVFSTYWGGNTRR